MCWPACSWPALSLTGAAAAFFERRRRRVPRDDGTGARLPVINRPYLNGPKRNLLSSFGPALDSSNFTALHVVADTSSSMGASFSHRCSARPRTVVMSVGADANTRFGFDARTQFEVAQRVQAIFGKRPVRIDGATQDQTDLIGDQTPNRVGHSSRGSASSSTRNLLCRRCALAGKDWNASANRLRCAKPPTTAFP